MRNETYWYNHRWSEKPLKKIKRKVLRCAGARRNVAGWRGVGAGELVTPYGYGYYIRWLAVLRCAGARRNVAGWRGVGAGELVTPYGYGYYIRWLAVLRCAGARRNVAGWRGVGAGELVTPYGYYGYVQRINAVANRSCWR